MCKLRLSGIVTPGHEPVVPIARRKDVKNRAASRFEAHVLCRKHTGRNGYVFDGFAINADAKETLIVLIDLGVEKFDVCVSLGRRCGMALG
jgi:hypothetical protein